MGLNKTANYGLISKFKLSIKKSLDKTLQSIMLKIQKFQLKNDLNFFPNWSHFHTRNKTANYGQISLFKVVMEVS